MCLDAWMFGRKQPKPYQGLELGLGIDKAENDARPKTT